MFIAQNLLRVQVLQRRFLALSSSQTVACCAVQSLLQAGSHLGLALGPALWHPSSGPEFKCYLPNPPQCRAGRLPALKPSKLSTCLFSCSPAWDWSKEASLLFLLPSFSLMFEPFGGPFGPCTGLYALDSSRLNL